MSLCWAQNVCELRAGGWSRAVSCLAGYRPLSVCPLSLFLSEGLAVQAMSSEPVKIYLKYWKLKYTNNCRAYHIITVFN